MRIANLGNRGRVPTDPPGLPWATLGPDVERRPPFASWVLTWQGAVPADRAPGSPLTSQVPFNSARQPVFRLLFLRIIFPAEGPEELRKLTGVYVKSDSPPLPGRSQFIEWPQPGG